MTYLTIFEYKPIQYEAIYNIRQKRILSRFQGQQNATDVIRFADCANRFIWFCVDQ